MKRTYFITINILFLLATCSLPGQSVEKLKQHVNSFSRERIITDQTPAHPQTNREDVVADFTSDDTVLIAGNIMHYFNLSTGEPTFQKWIFEGADPHISYVANPVIIYQTPGIFDVTLYVSGVNGSNTLIKEDYIEVLPKNLGLPPGWEYTNTMTQHTQIISLEVNPRIFETPINAGDYIGVFYTDDNQQLKCGGAVVWDGISNVAFPAQGDNYFTPSKDGFLSGEVFSWKLFSNYRQEEFLATSVYGGEFPLSFFVPNGISTLSGLYAGGAVQQVFPIGWSGVSSHILPWDNQLDEMFSIGATALDFMYGETGFFWPSQNLNSLEIWENSGYVVKMADSMSIVFGGYQANLFFDIHQGWNIIPVLCNCEVEIAELFQNNLNNIIIIKEIANIGLYWPEYAVFTLNYFVPGKAYFLNASSDFTIGFPTCP